MKRQFIGISAALLLAGSMAGVAQAAPDDSESQAKIRERIDALFPGQAEGEISASPVDGLYEVTLGPKILYVSGDGRYLVRGEIVDLETEENLTEPRQNEAQAAAVNAVGEENMVIFGDKDLAHTLTIFTDIDCGYCRKLHNEMDSYLDKGIRVRYLFFPRAGLNSESYDKAVSVWCSDDRQKAMTEAKAGEELEKKECDNPVKEHMALGQLVGVRGTPALMLESGQMVPGYIPAERLSKFLEGEKM